MKRSSNLLLLYTLIMAIPLTREVEYLSSNLKCETLMRFIILLLLIVQWVYSEANFSNHFPYAISLNHFKDAIAVLLETGTCIMAAFAAYKIGTEKTFYALIIAFLLFDLFIQLLTLPAPPIPTDGESPKFKAFRLTNTWIILDLVEAIFFAAGFAYVYFDPSEECFRSLSLGIIVMITTFFNFIKNGDFYFKDV